MLDLESHSWIVNAAAVLVAGGVIGISGVKLAALADRLADRTGWGEAITGVMFLGLTTALPGLATSVAAALDGHPALAIANAIGGIALQTTFLAVADLAHPRANLEHAAASVANMIQTVMLIALLAIVLIGLNGPEITIAHVHPVTPLLLGAALGGFWLVYRASNEPMWVPTRTAETVEDLPDSSHMRESLGGLIAKFLVNALVVTAAGTVVAHASGNIVEQTGLNEAVAGAFIAGVVTSLPELVTTIAAVRRGALTLAVSDIIGGNFFDVLFVFAADIVYLQGSIYHASGVGEREEFLTVLAILLNIVFLLGLLYRQRAGPANIGFESVLMLAIYASGFAVLTALM